MSIRMTSGWDCATAASASRAFRAVCTAYPCAPNTSSPTFRFMALSSTIRMASPDMGGLGSALFQHRQRDDRVELGEQCGGAVALHDDALDRRQELGALLARQVFHGPHNHGCAPADGCPAEAVQELESIHVGHQEIEYDCRGRRLGRRSQPVLGAADPGVVVAGVLECPGSELRSGLIVVYDEDVARSIDCDGGAPQ